MGRDVGLRLGAVLVAVAFLSACAATTSTTTDDATITTVVKIALLNDLRVSGHRLGVTTFKGVVTLSGTVATSEDGGRRSRSRAASPAFAT